MEKKCNLILVDLKVPLLVMLVIAHCIGVVLL